jgi:putative tricarboxylic transport membrane protein
MVGMAPIDAFTRFTFGQYQLLSGFDIVVILIGVFAVIDIIMSGFDRKHLGDKYVKKSFHLKGFGITLAEFRSQMFNMIRSSLIGIGIGILPGIGGSTAGFLSYTATKNSSKYPEKFGTGIIDGIIASETSNNAVIGGSLIPLLTMGIPGNTVTAIFLGGLTIHGISPGPLIFQKTGQYVYGIFFALIIANIFMLVIERAGLKIFVKLLDIPKHILLPIIMVCCVVGAYSSNSRIYDVWCVLCFGLLGILFKKLNIPSTPLIIGFILGKMAEENLRRALQASNGSWTVFFTRPISLVFLIITILSVVMTLKKNFESKKNLI